MAGYRCKFFIIQELVSPRIHEARGDRAWEMLDAGLLRAVDRLREKFGRIKINDWHNGGPFDSSGMRNWDDPEGAKYSDHKYGRAFDLKPLETPVKKVYDYIRAHEWEFPEITVLEDIAHTPSWLHVGARNHNLPQQIQIVRP